MKPETISYWKKVFFTTAIAFLSIVFLYLLMTLWLVETGPRFYLNTSVRYFLGKFCCILLFSFSLGFINRIPENKRFSVLVKRLLHLVLSYASFSLFMGLLFSKIYVLIGPLENSETTIKSENFLINSVIFIVSYFVVLGVKTLVLSLITPKEEKAYKSILD